MVGPPSRWAARHGTGRSAGSAAPSRGDPPSIARRRRLRQQRETGGPDSAGPAAVEEPAQHSMADSTERSVWADALW
eukprot:15447908-Alexandrium_andersonii.AAC.1